MKFSIKIIEAPDKGPRKETEVQGRDVNPEHISVADAEYAIKAEQYLERILGHRVHISQVA